MIQFSEPEQMNTAGRGAPGRTGVLWPQGDQQRTVSWVTVTYGFKLQQTPEVLASSTRQWLPLSAQLRRKHRQHQATLNGVAAFIQMSNHPNKD